MQVQFNRATKSEIEEAEEKFLRENKQFWYLFDKETLAKYGLEE